MIKMLFRSTVFFSELSFNGKTASHRLGPLLTPLVITLDQGAHTVVSKESTSNQRSDIDRESLEFGVLP